MYLWCIAYHTDISNEYKMTNYINNNSSVLETIYYFRLCFYDINKTFASLTMAKSTILQPSVRTTRNSQSLASLGNSRRYLGASMNVHLANASR